MSTIIPLYDGHIILIDKGLLHANYYFDSLPMYFCGEEHRRGWSNAFRFAAVTNEDFHKVTYSLLIIPRFFGFLGESIRVEKFDGSSMLQS